MLMKMLAKSVLSCEQMWMNLQKIFFHVVVHKSYSGLPPGFPHSVKKSLVLSLLFLAHHLESAEA